jgi:hypothetical protein
MKKTLKTFSVANLIIRCFLVLILLLNSIHLPLVFAAEDTIEKAANQISIIDPENLQQLSQFSTNKSFAEARKEALEAKLNSDADWTQKLVAEKLKTGKIENLKLTEKYTKKALSELKSSGVVTGLITALEESEIDPEFIMQEDKLKAVNLPVEITADLSIRPNIILKERLGLDSAIISGKTNKRIKSDSTPEIQEEIRLIAPAQLTNTETSYSSNQLLYHNFWSQVDFLLENNNRGFVANLLLGEDPNKASFNFIIETIGLKIIESENGDLIYFNELGEEQFRTQKPKIITEAGEQINSRSISFNLHWQDLNANKDALKTPDQPDQPVEPTSNPEDELVNIDPKEDSAQDYNKTDLQPEPQLEPEESEGAFEEPDQNTNQSDDQEQVPAESTSEEAQADQASSPTISNDQEPLATSDNLEAKSQNESGIKDAGLAEITEETQESVQDPLPADSGSAESSEEVDTDSTQLLDETSISPKSQFELNSQLQSAVLGSTEESEDKALEPTKDSTIEPQSADQDSELENAAEEAVNDLSGNQSASSVEPNEPQQSTNNPLEAQEEDSNQVSNPESPSQAETNQSETTNNSSVTAKETSEQDSAPDPNQAELDEQAEVEAVKQKSEDADQMLEKVDNLADLKKLTNKERSLSSELSDAEMDFFAPEGHQEARADLPLRLFANSDQNYEEIVLSSGSILRRYKVSLSLEKAQEPEQQFALMSFSTDSPLRLSLKVAVLALRKFSLNTSRWRDQILNLFQDNFFATERLGFNLASTKNPEDPPITEQLVSEDHQAADPSATEAAQQLDLTSDQENLDQRSTDQDLATDPGSSSPEDSLDSTDDKLESAAAEELPTTTESAPLPEEDSEAQELPAEPLKPAEGSNSDPLDFDDSDSTDQGEALETTNQEDPELIIEESVINSLPSVDARENFDSEDQVISKKQTPEQEAVGDQVITVDDELEEAISDLEEAVNTEQEVQSLAEKLTLATGEVLAYPLSLQFTTELVLADFGQRTYAADWQNSTAAGEYYQGLDPGVVTSEFDFESASAKVSKIDLNTIEAVDILGRSSRDNSDLLVDTQKKDDYLVAQAPGVMFQFTTKPATEIWAQVKRGQHSGMIKVTIDKGTANQVINYLNLSTPKSKQTANVLLASGLINTEHKVEIETLGLINPSLKVDKEAELLAIKQVFTLSGDLGLMGGNFLGQVISSDQGVIKVDKLPKKVDSLENLSLMFVSGANSGKIFEVMVNSSSKELILANIPENTITNGDHFVLRTNSYRRGSQWQTGIQLTQNPAATISYSLNSIASANGIELNASGSYSLRIKPNLNELTEEGLYPIITNDKQLLYYDHHSQRFYFQIQSLSGEIKEVASRPVGLAALQNLDLTVSWDPGNLAIWVNSEKSQIQGSYNNSTILFKNSKLNIGAKTISQLQSQLPNSQDQVVGSFPGIYSGFVVYNYALTDLEVYELYAANRPYLDLEARQLTYLAKQTPKALLFNAELANTPGANFALAASQARASGTIPQKIIPIDQLSRSGELLGQKSGLVDSEDLLAYWRLNNSYNDSSRFNRDLKLYNLAENEETFSKGKFGLAGNFAEIYNYAYLDDDPELSRVRTISFWVKFADLNQSNREILGKNEEYLFTYDNTEKGCANNQLGFAIYTNRWHCASALREVEAETWYQLSGVISEQEITFYLNGQLQSKVAIDQLFTDGDQEFTINSLLAGINGQIDEVALWQRSLSEQEIASLYHQAAGAKSYTYKTPIETTEITAGVDLGPSGGIFQVIIDEGTLEQKSLLVDTYAPKELSDQQVLLATNLKNKIHTIKIKNHFLSNRNLEAQKKSPGNIQLNYLGLSQDPSLSFADLSAPSSAIDLASVDLPAGVFYPDLSAIGSQPGKGSIYLELFASSLSSSNYIFDTRNPKGQNGLALKVSRPNQLELNLAGELAASLETGDLSDFVRKDGKQKLFIRWYQAQDQQLIASIYFNGYKVAENSFDALKLPAISQLIIGNSYKQQSDNQLHGAVNNFSIYSYPFADGGVDLGSLASSTSHLAAMFDETRVKTTALKSIKINNELELNSLDGNNRQFYLTDFLDLPPRLSAYQDNLLAYFDFNERIANLAGNNLKLLVDSEQSSQFRAGRFKQALSFKQSTSANLDFSQFAPLDNFTLTTWLQLDQVLASEVIFNINQNLKLEIAIAAESDQAYLRLSENQALDTQNLAKQASPSPKSNSVRAKIPVEMGKDTWLHLALKVAGQNLILYQNGVQVAILELDQADFSLNNIQIEQFAGALDELVVISEALTTKQIANLSQNTPQIFVNKQQVEIETSQIPSGAELANSNGLSQSATRLRIQPELSSDQVPNTGLLLLTTGNVQELVHYQEYDRGVFTGLTRSLNNNLPLSWPQGISVVIAASIKLAKAPDPESSLIARYQASSTIRQRHRSDFAIGQVYSPQVANPQLGWSSVITGDYWSSSNLVGYWPFDGSHLDQVGSNHLTTGSPLYTEGLVATASKGNTAGYFNADLPSLGEEFAFSFWFNYQGLSGDLLALKNSFGISTSQDNCDQGQITSGNWGLYYYDSKDQLICSDSEVKAEQGLQQIVLDGDESSLILNISGQPILTLSLADPKGLTESSSLSLGSEYLPGEFIDELLHFNSKLSPDQLALLAGSPNIMATTKPHSSLQTILTTKQLALLLAKIPQGFSGFLVIDEGTSSEQIVDFSTKSPEFILDTTSEISLTSGQHTVRLVAGSQSFAAKADSYYLFSGLSHQLVPTNIQLTPELSLPEDRANQDQADNLSEEDSAPVEEVIEEELPPELIEPQNDNLLLSINSAAKAEGQLQDLSPYSRQVISSGEIEILSDDFDLGQSAIYFPGEEGDFLAVTPNISNELSGPFTIDLWLQNSKQPKPSRQFILSTSPEDATGLNIVIEPDQSISIIQSGTTLINTNFALDQAWHNLTIVRTEQNELQLFIDHQLIGKRANFSQLISGSPAAMTIGSYYEGGANYQGYLDQIRIINNQVLLQEEQLDPELNELLSDYQLFEFDQQKINDLKLWQPNRELIDLPEDTWQDLGLDYELPQSLYLIARDTGLTLVDGQSQEVLLEFERGDGNLIDSKILKIATDPTAIYLALETSVAKIDFKNNLLSKLIGPNEYQLFVDANLEAQVGAANSGNLILADQEIDLRSASFYYNFNNPQQDGQIANLGISSNSLAVSSQGARLTSGIDGTGLEFDSGYLVPRDNLDLGEQFTFSAWLLPNDSLSGKSYLVGTRSSATNQRFRPEFYLEQGKVYFTLNGNKKFTNLELKAQLESGDQQKWQHVVITGSDSQFQLFVNGKLQDQQYLDSQQKINWDQVIIGANFLKGKPADFYQGQVDELLISKTNWTLAQVDQAYNQGLAMLKYSQVPGLISTKDGLFILNYNQATNSTNIWQTTQAGLVKLPLTIAAKAESISYSSTQGLAISTKDQLFYQESEGLALNLPRFQQILTKQDLDSRITNFSQVKLGSRYLYLATNLGLERLEIPNLQRAQQGVYLGVNSAVNNLLDGAVNQISSFIEQDGNLLVATGDQDLGSGGLTLLENTPTGLVKVASYGLTKNPDSEDQTLSSDIILALDWGVVSQDSGNKFQLAIGTNKGVNLLNSASRKVVITSGNNQEGALGSMLENLVEICLYDLQNQPLANTYVHLKPLKNSTSPDSLIVAKEALQTKESGCVETDLRLPSTVGNFQLNVATAFSITPKNERIIVASSVNPGREIAITQGNFQSGSKNSTLPTSLKACLTNVTNEPLPGEELHFSIAKVPQFPKSQGHNLSETSVLTDKSGCGEVRFTFGDRAGLYQVVVDTENNITPLAARTFSLTQANLFEFKSSANKIGAKTRSASYNYFLGSFDLAVDTNAASYEIYLKPTTWPQVLGGNSEVDNWNGSQGLGWSTKEQANQNSFASDATGQPAETLFYSCGLDDNCQQNYNPQLNLEMRFGYDKLAGAYLNNLQIYAKNICFNSSIPLCYNPQLALATKRYQGYDPSLPLFLVRRSSDNSLQPVWSIAQGTSKVKTNAQENPLEFKDNYYVVWWIAQTSRLGPVKNSGQLTTGNYYQISATTNNYFCPGCQEGDFFEAQSSLTLSEDNQVRPIIGQIAKQKDFAKQPQLKFNQQNGEAAVDFDGVDDFLEVSSTLADLQIDQSISLLANFNDREPQKLSVLNSWSAANLDPFDIFLPADGRISLYNRQKDGYHFVSKINAMKANSWQSAILKHSPSKNELYLQGKLKYSQSLTTKIPSQGKDLKLGAFFDGSKMTNHFNGQLNNFTLYNYDLSQGQAQNLSDYLQNQQIIITNDQSTLRQTTLSIKAPKAENLVVDWGDGTQDRVSTKSSQVQNFFHNYAQVGDYQIVISGDLDLVTELSILNNQENLQIPLSSLKSLASLERLYLSGSEVEGSISDLGDFPQLKSINISNTKLADYPRSSLINSQLTIINLANLPLSKGVIEAVAQDLDQSQVKSGLLNLEGVTSELTPKAQLAINNLRSKDWEIILNDN